MMITEIEKELREWLRPVSPLTAFVKSIRCEGETVKTDTPAPLFDFDFDDLPTDIKEKIVAAKKTFEEQGATLKQTEERRKSAEEFARKNQSEASKAKAVLQRHNLSIDGHQGPVVPAADAAFDARVARFVKDGLPEPQAKAYAKMFSDEATQLEQQLLAKFTPLVQNVGALQTNSALVLAQAQYPHVFAKAELAKEINDAAGYMLSQGNVPNDAAIKSLVEMAWGKAVLADPTILTEKKGQELNTSLPNLKSTLTNGLRTQTQTDPSKPQRPAVTQPETMAIMAQVNQELMRGMPVKKGGK